MKKTLVSAVLVFVLVIASCTSTGGKVNSAWDYRMVDQYYGALYLEYVPNYDNYVEVSLGQAISAISSNKNFDGYYYTRDMVVLDRMDNRFTVIPLESLRQLERNGNFRSASGEGIPMNHSGVMANRIIPLLPDGEMKQPKSFDIITVWYRGLCRVHPSNKYVEAAKNIFLDKYEVTGKFTRELNANEQAEADKRATAEAERQQPRFSPEGNEYVKRTLTQAVGEANNQANRGKTLFFESTVTMKRGTVTGQWQVSDTNSNSITLMECYGNTPMILLLPTILYRVEISNIGYARFVIDSFRE